MPLYVEAVPILLWLFIQGVPQPRAILIRGATVVDGTGAPGRVADVRIVDATIRDIGRLVPTHRDSVVDARGLVLAPGFIDTHTHHDDGLDSERTALAATSQGITTIVVGQDGWSEFPLADFFARLEQRPAAVNVASYVGHGRLRSLILGDQYQRHATAAEMTHMSALLQGEMAAGALGLSSGLEYDPGIYSSTDEIVALARVAARNGGRYISHIRSEDRRRPQSTGDRDWPRAHLVQISHAKLAMRSLWGEADSLVGLLDRARASGVQVTLDVYPYTYWQSTLTVLFPGRDFHDTSAARFALTEVTLPDSAILSAFDADTTLVGKSIAEIAALRHTDPFSRSSSSSHKRSSRSQVAVSSTRASSPPAWCSETSIASCNGPSPMSAATAPLTAGTREDSVPSRGSFDSTFATGTCSPWRKPCAAPPHWPRTMSAS
jgi:N-acyl-D-amino-acid deacylase